MLDVAPLDAVLRRGGTEVPGQVARARGVIASALRPGRLERTDGP